MSSESCFFGKIGPLKIKLSGDSVIVNSISKDMALISDLGDDPMFDIVVSIVPQFSTPNENVIYSGKKTLFFDKNKIVINLSPYFYLIVDGLFNKKSKTNIVLVKKESSVVNKTLAFMKQSINIEADTLSKLICAEFMSYSYFWSILALTLLKKDMAFIHSGAFYKNDLTYLIAGTGGCGKTSSVLASCLNDSEYYTEDFGIIDSEGMIYQCPKTITLFNSDLGFQKEVKNNLYGKLSLKKKIKWILLNDVLKKNTFLKVSPLNIFPNIAISARKINKAYYFTRNSGDSIKVEKMSLQEISKRIALSSYRELMPFITLLMGVSANQPNEFENMNPLDIFSRMEEIVLKSICYSEQYSLSAPLSAKPRDILKAMSDE